MIILIQRHDYSYSKTQLFLLKYMIIMFKNTIILVQRHDYSCSKTRLLCSKTRLFLLKNMIIISGCTKIKSGCTESNTKTCIKDTIILIQRHDYSCSKTRLFLFKYTNILVQMHEHS